MYYGKYRPIKKNEFNYTCKIMRKKYKIDVKVVNAEQFLYSLKNISDQKKRKIIGKLFIKVFEEAKIKNKFFSTGYALPRCYREHISIWSKIIKN